MSQRVYRFEFTEKISMREVERFLVTALRDCESLHGCALVRLDVDHLFDESRRIVVIDAATEVGQSLAQLFIGRLQRKFAAEAFLVERLEDPPVRRRRDGPPGLN